MRILVAIVVGLFLASPTLTLAEPVRRPPPKKEVKKQPPNQKYAPVQRLTFDGDTVEAGRAGGAGEVIGVVRRPKISSLIPVRTHFIPELIKSAEDV